jgi:hypothetical protein
VTDVTEELVDVADSAPTQTTTTSLFCVVVRVAVTDVAVLLMPVAVPSMDGGGNGREYDRLALPVEVEPADDGVVCSLSAPPTEA